MPVARVDRLRWLEIHKRLAITNWSYAFACVVDVLRLPVRPTAILTRDPRLAWAFLLTKPLHRRPVVYEVHEIFSTRSRDNRSLDPAEIQGVADRTRALEDVVFSQADLLLPLTQACAEIVERNWRVEADRMVVSRRHHPARWPTAAPRPVLSDCGLRWAVVPLEGRRHAAGGDGPSARGPPDRPRGARQPG